MPRTIILLIIVSFCFCLRCASRPGLLYLGEESSAELWLKQGGLKTILEDVASQHGYLFNVTILKESDYNLAAIKNACQNLPSDIVVADPLLAPEVIQVASQFKTKLFLILPGLRLREVVPPNVISAIPARREEFFKLGQRVAEVITGNYRPELGKKLGIICGPLGTEALEEMTELEKGFTTRLGAENIIRENLADYQDKVKAIRVVENQFNQGVRIWFLKAYGLNPACIEKIVSLGGRFIIENYSLYKAYPERLLFTIENDYQQALQEAIKYFGKTPPPRLLLKAKIISGSASKGFESSEEPSK